MTGGWVSFFVVSIPTSMFLPSNYRSSINFINCGDIGTNLAKQL